jgi:GntR family transcriptional regulator
MQFHENRPIYMQIVDYVCDEILSGDWTAENRIPSVREMAAQIEVNPNTAMRAYHYLQERGVLEQKRGVGYFASEDAQEQVLDLKRREFLEEDLPRFVQKMERLGYRFQDLESLVSA